MPDLRAIGGRIGKASLGVAVVRRGMHCVEQLALEKSPVAVKKTWGTKFLDVFSDLLWRS